MPSITPFLWFDTQAEEAMNFYASIFKRSKVISVSGVQGKVMSVQFELEGQRFMALNAGPLYKFTEAISFFVGCDTQQEIDELWGKLVADGGEPSRCGWLKDKFGLSWQIIPNTLGQMLGDKDPAKARRAMTAMMQMGKLDLEQLTASGVLPAHLPGGLRPRGTTKVYHHSDQFCTLGRLRLRDVGVEPELVAIRVTHLERPVAPPLQLQRIAQGHALLLQPVVKGVHVLDFEVNLDRLFAIG